MKVSINDLRRRFKKIEQLRKHYEWKSEQPGRLQLQEVWRHTYLANPYLMGAPADRVAERFCQIFMNAMELGQDGKIGLGSLKKSDLFMRGFTHLLEEYASRGGQPPSEVIATARTPLLRYFEDGEPIGVRMFKTYEPPTSPIVVKYGQRQFLEPMLKFGDLRLANAGLYNDINLLNSIRDDEISRTFFMPTYKERLAGKTKVEFMGHNLQIDDDDIKIPLEFDDYYLFSLCEHVHYRMPTDFKADAAIVIRDPLLFQQRIISTFLSRFPDWTPMFGRVNYYDPYQDFPDFKRPEMSKHFGYSYQKEVRLALRPQRKLISALEPIFLNIGSMEAYAELVTI